MPTLRGQLVRLAYNNPQHRADLLPLLGGVVKSGGRSKPLTQKMIKDADALLKLRGQVGKKLIKYLKEHIEKRTTPDETDLIGRAEHLIAHPGSPIKRPNLDVNPELSILTARRDILESLNTELTVAFLVEPSNYRAPSPGNVFPTKFVASWLYYVLRPMIVSTERAMDRASSERDEPKRNSDSDDAFYSDQPDLDDAH